MVTIATSIPSTIKLRLRPSMIKFYSDYHILEILDYSKTEKGFLDRQKILILSHLGIPDEIFLQRQENGKKEYKF